MLREGLGSTLAIHTAQQSESVRSRNCSPGLRLEGRVTTTAFLPQSCLAIVAFQRICRKPLLNSR
jgi:hypothetical protein